MPPADVNRLAARTFTFDGIDFRSAPLGAPDGGAHGDPLTVVKPLEEIEQYRELIASHKNPRMVELGIAYGGSVALFALMARPSRLVALDLAAGRQPLLDAFIAEQRLEDLVRLHYGVDQADSARLLSIVETEFGGESLDIVIDDASHLYRETVSTFQTLFPLLRPGGDYIIEDWRCDHGIRALLVQGLEDPGSWYHDWAVDALAGRIESGHPGQPPQTAIAAGSIDRPANIDNPPLSLIGLQLVLAAAEEDSGVASVTSGPFWLRVVRDDTPLRPEVFTVAAAAPDHFGLLRSRI